MTHIRMSSRPSIEEENPGGAVPAAVEEELVVESLVEEVSIDGMCGVY